MAQSLASCSLAMATGRACSSWATFILNMRPPSGSPANNDAEETRNEICLRNSLSITSTDDDT